MSNVSNNSNISSNSNTQIGGLAYFLVYLSDYLPYVIIGSSGTIIGVLGNLIIMLTIIVNAELHSDTYMLMFNLSLADIIISGFVDTFTTIGVVIGSTFFEEHTSLCIFIASICFIACCTSLVNIGFLAINRYIHICHNNLYKKLFSTKLTLLYCVITWICGVLIDVPNFTGWGGHSYDNVTLSCVWNRLSHQSYTIFFAICFIVIPCVSIFFCYMRIFLFSYKSKNKANSLSSDVQSIRLAQCLFTSFMLFTVCWLPYGIIVMVDYDDKLPRSAVMFTMTFAHLNSSLNPILYAIFNSSFRRGYVNLFNRICCIRIFKLPSNMIRNLTERQATN